jgi:dTDP-4-dehydrorhamnose 3,5-epimerase
MDNKLTITELPLKGTFLINTLPFQDDRGEFMRFFCEDELKHLMGKKNIVQVNYSLTNMKGSVRGMHFQSKPKAEMKFVRCIKGSVFDVMVDVRKESPTYLKWYGVTLSKINEMIFIPEGFAHGFQTLESNCEMLYFHTEFYSKEYEHRLKYDDPSIGIEWKLPITNVSEDDRDHPFMNGLNKGE